MPDLTPVERRGAYWVKRDDLYEMAGVRGGKVRTCWALAQGAAGLVTAGSRHSPQINIVAHIAGALGIPCRAHTTTGRLSPEVQRAQALGAEVVQHRPGYNTVLIARARADAQARGWCEIPFGMECREAVEQTAQQVANLPREAERVVVPVGSGMSLAGILTGLDRMRWWPPVVGVVTGADPTRRLDAFAPWDWRFHTGLVTAAWGYHKEAPTRWAGLTLDPIYEAKCVPLLRPADLLWCVGCRETVATVEPITPN